MKLFKRSLTFVIALLFAISIPFTVFAATEPLNEIVITPSLYFNVKEKDFVADVTQGGCYDDGYIYLYMRDGKDKTKNYGVFVMYEPKTNIYFSKEIYAEHGNDMTYNPVMNQVIIAGGKYYNEEKKKEEGSNRLYCVSNSGEIRNVVSVKGLKSIIGISFIRDKKQYLMLGRKNNGQLVYKYYSMTYEPLSTEISYHQKNNSDIVQGIDADSNYVYASQAEKSNKEGYISVTSLTNKQYVCRYSFDTSRITFIHSGEVENVSNDKTKFYIGINVNSSNEDAVYKWEYSIGDANNDKTINMKDVLLLNKYLAGQDVDISYLAADADKNGTVNSNDAAKIRNIIAGIAKSKGVLDYEDA